MRSLTLVGLVFGSMLAAFGQNPFPNPVRPMPVPPNASPYGNILFPGGIPNSFPGQLGATVAGRPYPGVQPGGGHVGGGPGRPRTVVVPYAVPVYYGGGYGYDPYYAQQQQQPNVTVVVPQQPAPTVIINQTFGGGELTKQEVASADVERGGLKVFEAPKAPATPEGQSISKRSYVRDDKPNIYLIALKDSNKVREAIGYWVEGGATLAYVTPDAEIERVALDLVDREGSKQLNAQRNLQFELRSR